MIDLVIPLSESKTDFLDLKYCLRSVERHLDNYNEIVIVGAKPKWIQGAVHIPFSDATHKKFKEKNILNKLTAACMDRRVTKNFALLNDDYVFLDSVDISKYPNYYRGTCREAFDMNVRNDYRKTVYHTLKFIESRGYKDRYFDGHCPIIYNKEKFMSTFDFNDVNFDTPWGYCIKTLYAVCNRLKGTFMEDVKFQRSLPREEILEVMKGRHVISYNDHPLRTDLGDILKEMFPEKSSYEK